MDRATGLTHGAVESSRKKHGYNEVAEQKEHPLLKFLGKFWGLSAWMLELIMILSLVLRNYADLAIRRRTAGRQRRVGLLARTTSRGGDGDPFVAAEFQRDVQGADVVVGGRQGNGNGTIRALGKNPPSGGAAKELSCASQKLPPKPQASKRADRSAR